MRTSIQVAWECPDSGNVKLNSDGMARRDNNEAGCGALLRDDTGKWTIGCTRNLGACSAFMAEIWGILAGLRLAKKMQMTRVVVECDSLAAVQVIKSTNNGGDGTSGMIGCY